MEEDNEQPLVVYSGLVHASKFSSGLVGLGEGVCEGNVDGKGQFFASGDGVSVRDEMGSVLEEGVGEDRVRYPSVLILGTRVMRVVDVL